MAEFKYLGTIVTNRNLIQEEIKIRLNSRNACYHAVQNLLSSRLLSENEKIKIRMREMRNAYRILVGSPEGKRPLGRPRCRWEDNIKVGTE
jgi:hypothetical protein